MQTRSYDRYSRTAIGLHWLLALMIACSFGVGLYMADLPLSPLRLRLINWHKWAGVTILLLSALRLGWRLTHAPPALPQAVLRAMLGWQRYLHQGTLGLLYVLFFAVPLLGWAYSSAMGFSVVWLGVLPLPDFVAPDEALAKGVLLPLHRAGAYLLAALVVVHVAGVLKHRWIDRVDLLGRMWPARGKGASQ